MHCILIQKQFNEHIVNIKTNKKTKSLSLILACTLDHTLNWYLIVSSSDCERWWKLFNEEHERKGGSNLFVLVHPPLVSLKTSVFPPSHFIKHLINQTNPAHTGEIWGHMVHRELNLELPVDPMS